MAITTFKEYKKAIREHYEIIKAERFSGSLNNPSPAQIRAICFAICDKGLSKIDEETFKFFFETKENEPLKKAIENFNIDKFRPIIKFLKKGSDTENSVRVEMAAIIVGFEIRPYSKYLNADSVEKDGREVSIVEDEENKILANAQLNNTEKSEKIKKKILIGVIGFVIFSLIVYSLNNIIDREKQCMIWEKNHYERIDCQSKNLGFTHGIVKPYNEVEFELKKISVCDTTTFFKNGKAIVWYSKKDGKVDFFNKDGINPENGAELKRVTQHMIDKYVKPCK